jgi:hypothetical protein
VVRLTLLMLVPVEKEPSLGGTATLSAGVDLTGHLPLQDHLLGTAGYEPNISVVDAAFVWYSQVALIVGGYVFAVYLAHATALCQMSDDERALMSQFPMVALMILYTVLGLWIHFQPVAG